MTWLAHNQQVCPQGLEYSHRCNNNQCINPQHGVWETPEQNLVSDLNYTHSSYKNCTDLYCYLLSLPSLVGVAQMPLTHMWVGKLLSIVPILHIAYAQKSSHQRSKYWNAIN